MSRAWKTEYNTQFNSSWWTKEQRDVSIASTAYLSSLLSEGLYLFSSKTDESDSLCFLRFPSAPRFLPWDQRGRGCGLEADKPRQREHARWVYLINLSVTPSYAVTVVYLLVLLQETKPGDTRSCGPPESPHREALPRKDTPLLTAPQPAPHRPPLQTMAGTRNPGVYTPLPLPPRGGSFSPASL